MESILHLDAVGLYLSVESFWNDTILSLSVSLYIYTHTHTHVWLLPEGFEHESFSLKFNTTKFKYNNSVEVDLHYLK